MKMSCLMPRTSYKLSNYNTFDPEYCTRDKQLSVKKNQTHD